MTQSLTVTDIIQPGNAIHHYIWRNFKLSTLNIILLPHQAEFITLQAIIKSQLHILWNAICQSLSFGLK